MLETKKNKGMHEDEAGIFVAMGPTKVVSPRLHLFLEIGAAWRAASMSARNAVSWVEDRAGRTNRGETLVLAAGLSKVVAGALIDRACREQGPLGDRLAAEAAQGLAEGGTVEDEQVERLVQRLLPTVRRGGEAGWAAAKAACRVRVAVGVQQQILDAVRANLPAEYAVLAKAQGSVTWNWPRRRRDDALEAVFGVQRPPRLGPPSIFADQTRSRLLVVAAAELLPRRPDVATAVAAAAKQVGMRAAEELQNILWRTGHQELARESASTAGDRRFSEEVSKLFRRMSEDYETMLRSLLELGPHRGLRLCQERRLGELAAFAATLELNDRSAWLTGSRWRGILPDWLRLIAALGGFDTGVIASQAAVVIREASFEGGTGHRPFVDLLEHADEETLDRWEGVVDVEGARALLLRVLHAPRGAAMVAARALAEHPDREGTASVVRSAWHGLPRESVVCAVWCYSQLAGDDAEEVAALSFSSNEHVREAVARMGDLVDDGGPTEECVRLAKDDVRQVRLAVIDRLDEAAEEKGGQGVVRLLRKIELAGDVAFRCYHCGKACEASEDSCSSCRVVTERSTVAAGKRRRRLEVAKR